MAVVVLKKRNIRILVTTILLVGLTFTVLRSNTATTSNITSFLNSEQDNQLTKEATKEQALVDYESVEDPAKVRPSIDLSQEKEINEQQQQIQDDNANLQPIDEVKSDYQPASFYLELMKQAPIIMFSKTYCPFSRRLKDLLSAHFEFSPSIIVYELDEDPHGTELQAYIAEVTGRKTVPNLIINGESRGGFDDINALFEKDGEQNALLKELQDWSNEKFTVTQKTK